MRGIIERKPRFDNKIRVVKPMFLKPSAVVLFLALGSVPAFAQSPIRLDAGDVYFQFRPARQKDAVGLCGFTPSLRDGLRTIK
jgi:hypothetical protein